MPADSSWKTPLVSPRWKSSKVLGSSSGRWSRSIGASGCRCVDEPDGRGEGGEVAQAEEVHLQQPGLLDVAHLPLGGDDLLGLVLVGELLERDELLERPVGDHDARGVRADVAVHPLEPAGEVEQPRDLGVFLGQPPQRRLFLEGLLERDVEPRGDQLVDLLDPRQRDVQRPADVLDRRLGLERAEGADLGDVGVAVLLPDVLDDLVPPLLAQVDVDVGRLGAVGVEEPLEQQVVLERADVAELEQVADQGAAGRAAGRARGCPARGRSGRSPRRSGSTRRTPSG